MAPPGRRRGRTTDDRLKQSQRRSLARTTGHGQVRHCPSAPRRPRVPAQSPVQRGGRGEEGDQLRSAKSKNEAFANGAGGAWTVLKLTWTGGACLREPNKLGMAAPWASSSSSSSSPLQRDGMCASDGVWRCCEWIMAPATLVSADETRVEEVEEEERRVAMTEAKGRSGRPRQARTGDAGDACFCRRAGGLAAAVVVVVVPFARWWYGLVQRSSISGRMPCQVVPVGLAGAAGGGAMSCAVAGGTWMIPQHGARRWVRHWILLRWCCC